jgi:hypothetical protein
MMAVPVRPGQWSPDGTRFASFKKESLVVVDLRTGQRREIARNVASFEWSPDGRRFVYDEPGRGFTQKIFVADAATGVKRQLARGADPRWAGNNRIYFTAKVGEDEYGYNTKTVSVRDDGTARRASAFADTALIYVSSNGKHVVFQDDDDKLEVAAVPSLHRRRLEGAGGDFVIAWAPDNRTIAAYDTQTGSLTRIDTQTGRRREVIAEGYFVSGESAWAPGSDRLAFTAAYAELPYSGPPEYAGTGEEKYYTQYAFDLWTTAAGKLRRMTDNRRSRGSVESPGWIPERLARGWNRVSPPWFVSGRELERRSFPLSAARLKAQRGRPSRAPFRCCQPISSYAGCGSRVSAGSAPQARATS